MRHRIIAKASSLLGRPRLFPQLREWYCHRTNCIYSGYCFPFAVSCNKYSTILADYQKLQADKVLRSDPNQLAVVSKLQQLQERLEGYEAGGAIGGISFLNNVSKLNLHYYSYNCVLFSHM